MVRSNDVNDMQTFATASAISESVLIVSVLATAAFVLWLAVSELARRQRLTQLLAFRLKVLDRLNAVEGGDVARIVAELVRADESRETERGVRAAQLGVVSLAATVGLVGLMIFNLFGVPEVWLALALLSGVLGIGFLGAAWLARRWRP
jgi:predicted PurR-regulated permease PerM